MRDETIHVNSAAVDKFLGVINKNTSGLDSAYLSVSNDFPSATSKNLYRGGMKKISNQIDEVNKKMKNYKRIVKKYTDQYFLFDNLAAKRMDELSIPNNFDINDSIEENIFDKVNLNKQDGLSVNNGDNNATTINDNGFLYQNVLSENLDNIKSANKQEEQIADDIVSIAKETIDNIKNDNKQEEQIYDENSSIYNNTLNKINSNQSLSFDEYLKDIIENKIFDDDKFVVQKGE